MSILINILLVCHGTCSILCGHYIHYNHRTMSFISILFLNFHIIIMWSKKKKGNRCHLININSKKVNSNFSQRSVLTLFAQGIYVPGGICPRGYMSQGVYVTKHSERMLQCGTFECSMHNIKGKMSNFRGNSV